jgi:uncharacterized 2Fe-2S/4Fe-4S cluster protein (DUF4445 family)
MPVQLQIDDATLDAPPGSSLFECSEQMGGVRIPTSCLKNGKCRECMVEVEEGMDCLTPRSPEEDHLRGAFRLACRARISTEAGTIRCHTLRRGQLQITELGATGGLAEHQAIDPAVTRSACSHDEILIDGEPVGKWTGNLHGIAVDLGTTTVVARLVDLETGAVCATRSFENPQRFGGSDVMSRIQYDSDHPGRLLQRTLTGYLAHAIEDFGCDVESIFEIVVAGNSTMRDLFFGLDVTSIGQRPYRSSTEHELNDGNRATTALVSTAKRLRLPANSAARVCGLPLISGHVGADTASCLLAIGLADEDRLVALMDIGTNTEFVVGNREKIFVASCPAGPAFEGGVITCGMPGLEGAIESVRLGADCSVAYEVIGGLPPEGICGSGIVDLLSELLRTERMNSMGRFVDESDHFAIDRDRRLTLSEADISELAQAKAANIAGAQIVLKQSGVDPEKIERFYLAGGFADHLDLAAAVRIGLIPAFPDDRIVRIGNAAIEGATLALLSASRRDQLEALVRRAVHVELETDEQFFDHFVDGCQFRPSAVVSNRAAEEEMQDSITG